MAKEREVYLMKERGQKMIQILSGNLFDTNAQIICHQCNRQGVMGSGVAAEVKRRYPEVFKEYCSFLKKPYVNLGSVLVVDCNEKRAIANLIAQDKYGWGKQFTNYEALHQCLRDLKEIVNDIYGGKVCKIAFPYGMGSVRGGGDWSTVYKIIEEELGDYDVEIWKLN